MIWAVISPSRKDRKFFEKPHVRFKSLGVQKEEKPGGGLLESLPSAVYVWIAV